MPRRPESLPRGVGRGPEQADATRAATAPPATLTTATYTPERGRLGLDGTRVFFRTAPSRLRLWLRRIDRWVEYANSVVEG